MSAESLIGGDYENLSSTMQDLLDNVFASNIGGVVKTDLGGGATLVQGTGADGVRQTAVFSSTGQAIAGEIQDGQLSLTIALPANVGVVATGPGEGLTPDQAEKWLMDLVDEALPAGTGDSGVEVARATLINSIQAAVQSLQEGGEVESVSLRLVALAGNSTTPSADGEVFFEGTGQTQEMLAFLMHELGTDKTLVLKGVSSAFIIGAGSARVEGSEGSAVAGDLSNQLIVGGAGNDTIIGGGGNDTITGGGGSDIFGITGLGHLTITDFNVATDKLAVGIKGIDNIADLIPLFDGVTVEGSSTTLNFAGGAVSITLMGVSAEQLTTDLFTFDF